MPAAAPRAAAVEARQAAAAASMLQLASRAAFLLVQQNCAAEGRPFFLWIVLQFDLIGIPQLWGCQGVETGGGGQGML